MKILRDVSFLFKRITEFNRNVEYRVCASNNWVNSAELKIKLHTPSLFLALSIEASAGYFLLKGLSKLSRIHEHILRQLPKVEVSNPSMAKNGRRAINNRTDLMRHKKTFFSC